VNRRWKKRQARSDAEYRRRSKRARGRHTRWSEEGRVLLRQMYEEQHRRRVLASIEEARRQTRETLGPYAPVLDVFERKYPEIWLRAYSRPDGDLVVDLVLGRGDRLSSGQYSATAVFSQVALADQESRALEFVCDVLAMRAEHLRRAAALDLTKTLPFSLREVEYVLKRCGYDPVKARDVLRVLVATNRGVEEVERLSESFVSRSDLAPGRN
jgi:hypothetical protein